MTTLQQHPTTAATASANKRMKLSPSTTERVLHPRPAAAIVNSQNHVLLIGSNSCSSTGGGPFVNCLAETGSGKLVLEEVGIKVGTHVMVTTTTSATSAAISNAPSSATTAAVTTALSSNTSSTSNDDSTTDLTESFQNWTIFRCMDARGDKDPNIMCTKYRPHPLTHQEQHCGNRKTPPSCVCCYWQPIQEIIKNHNSSGSCRLTGPQHVNTNNTRELYFCYRALQNILENIVAPQWEEQLQALDFTGIWLRDWMDAAQALMQRGLSYEEAITAAEQPYVQKWERGHLTAHLWLVTTYNDENQQKPRRILEYQEGEWEEFYQGASILFGPTPTDRGFTLRRRTCYVAEPQAEPLPIAHATVTLGPKGIEETRRYLKADQMMVRRTLWSNAAPDKPIVSTEVFFRSTV